VAQGIATAYRTAPGRNADECKEFETHSAIVWAFQSLFKVVESNAGYGANEKTEKKKVDDDNGWDDE